MSTQLRNGWRLLPLTVGLQASCSDRARYAGKKISSDPTSNYATAREQGRVEARTTVRTATRLGIAERSTLWYDIEAFDTSRVRCRKSALSFLSAWTNTLHSRGYVSGVYSSASSGIKMLDEARVSGGYAMPDQIWIAEWMTEPVRAAPLRTPPSLFSSYIGDDGWMPRQRMRQYRRPQLETHGGVQIEIDTDYLDLGRGSVAPRVPNRGGVQVDFPHYRWLAVGDDGAEVKAARCLLRRKHFYEGELRFWFTWKTDRAVRAFQQARDLPVNGIMTHRTWTALLSEGRSPVLKIGSARDAVRRVRRGLNAAVAAQLAVTGVFDVATTRAVRVYQIERGLRRTGVVASDTWADLADGRI